MWGGGIYMMIKEAKVYDIINEKACSNSIMQGLTGWCGFPFTLFGDVAVFWTHYKPMLNDIRKVYGRAPLSIRKMLFLLNGCEEELLTDLVVDKVVGNLPVIGLPANVIAAKALTWRLGILFGMLASQGSDVSIADVEQSIGLIRSALPNKKSFFVRPSVTLVAQLIYAAENGTYDLPDFNLAVQATTALG